MFILYCKIQDQFLNLHDRFSLYVVICHTLVIHFLVLRDVIISCVYISNDILFVFMIAVATMDHNNAEILRFIVYLREIGSAWRAGDELRRSLSNSLLYIVDTIARLNDALYSIASYRERKRQQYVDGLSYNEVKKQKITKEHIYTLFRLPGTDDILEINMPHIYIEWCTFPAIKDNWMDRWYMNFDIPPHNNRELPLYFLQNLYAKIVMGIHVNYFDMLGFQGVGRGMPQH